MNKVLALILAGGMGNRLSILAEERAKPAVVFAGKYRVIDFPLTNCVNSGISQVGVLTQYRPRSLMQHIGLGKPWDLDRERGGVSILQPFIGRQASDWYRGTADAVHQNLYFVEESHCEQVLILAGDHIYKMNYEGLISFHRYKKADVTVGVIEVPREEASRFGLVVLDQSNAVVEFQEKPKEPKSLLGSMGIYVFEKQFLVKALTEDARRQDSTHDFGRDIITSYIGKAKAFGYKFRGYWRDIGTIDSYYTTSMELLQEPPPIELNGRPGGIRTRSQDRPPVKTGPRAKITQSLVSNGCVILGEVRHSILSPGVYVEEGALVEDSILFDDTHVGKSAVVNKAILDKEVRVGRGAVVGSGEDKTPNTNEPSNLWYGITLVGKRARVPPKAQIGRNVVVHPAAVEKDFPSLAIPSGSTVLPNRETVHGVAVGR